MGVALGVVWAILGLLWLVTAPGVLVAFAAVGDPPPGFLPGWVIAFLGWLSVPVTVVLALVAIAGDGAIGVRPWLPVASLLVVAAGYLDRARERPGGRPAGDAIRRHRRRQPPPAPPPRRLRPGDLDALDDDALAAHQLDVVGAAVARWFPDATPASTPRSRVSSSTASGAATTARPSGGRSTTTATSNAAGGPSPRPRASTPSGRC